MNLSAICDKVFKSGLSKFCGRQPIKNLLSPLLNTMPYTLETKMRLATENNYKLLRMFV